jgi:hypothetical protein
MANQGNRSGPAMTVSAIRSGSGSLGFGGGSIGALQGISLGGPTSLLGDGSFGRHLQVGIFKETTIGNPTQPSMREDIPGFFRFRWGVLIGTRSIQINVMQPANSTPRPTMTVKANSAVGLAADLAGTAGASTGWVVIGPLSFVCTAAGYVWVELRNNYYGQYNSPCYWDHRIAS